MSGAGHSPGITWLRPRAARLAALLLAASVLLVLAVGYGCRRSATPLQATLALTGDFRGFQRPCG